MRTSFKEMQEFDFKSRCINTVHVLQYEAYSRYLKFVLENGVPTQVSSTSVDRDLSSIALITELNVIFKFCFGEWGANSGVVHVSQDLSSIALMLL
ncbi:hypothetical protein TNCV_2188201 [Trichonephila clavipes]|nr:hypothetical protein TNCV_2188201 [Trichonephila clavipes]